MLSEEIKNTVVNLIQYSDRSILIKIKVHLVDINDMYRLKGNETILKISNIDMGWANVIHEATP